MLALDVQLVALQAGHGEQRGGDLLRLARLGGDDPNRPGRGLSELAEVAAVEQRGVPLDHRERRPQLMDGDVEQLRLGPLGGIQLAHRVGRLLVGGGVAQGDPGDGSQGAQAGPLVVMEGRVLVTGEDEQAGDLAALQDGDGGRVADETQRVEELGRGPGGVHGAAGDDDPAGERLADQRLLRQPGGLEAAPDPGDPLPATDRGLDGQPPVPPAREGRAVGGHQARSLVEDRVDHRAGIQRAAHGHGQGQQSLRIPVVAGLDAG